ncbi:hypothetical protein B0H13DRAFT_2329637 [Mycena leptocephala]|nr:hypothetical protein B0H13DRAFT_2329637 [Mycena leptocephala]
MTGIQNASRLVESTSPILQECPAEMLAEIFMSCVALTEYRSRTELDTREAPWKLGKICNRWRAVAISTPRLWRIIAIRLHTDLWNIFRPSPQSLLYLVTLFLERSGNCPFALGIYCRKMIPPSSCQIIPTATMVGLTRGLSVSAPLPAPRVLKINTKLRIAAETPQATFPNMIRSRIGTSPTGDARLEVLEINKAKLDREHWSQLLAMRDLGLKVVQFGVGHGDV